MSDSPSFTPINPPLQRYIRSFWSVRAEGSDAPYRLPPEPCFDIILSFGANREVTGNNGATYSIEGSFIAGMRTGPFSLAPTGDVDYLAIRCYPWGLRPLLGLSCRALTDCFVELAAIGGRLSEALRPVLDVGESDAERVQMIQKRLQEILPHGADEASRGFRHAVQTIETHGGRVGITELCRDIGLTTRQFHREAERFLGISPKQFARTVRFSRCLERLLVGQADDLADLALECGYYDQAHMIHECSELAGLTPTQLRGPQM